MTNKLQSSATLHGISFILGRGGVVQVQPTERCQPSKRARIEPNEGLDVTAVMVFGVSAIGLGGFSLFSLLGLIGFG